MRTQYILIAMFSLFLMASTAQANTPENGADSAASNAATDSTAEAASGKTADEEALPDAMSRLIKAPEIDVDKIRDPFLSSIEKNRIEEAKRFKNRKMSPTNKRKRDVLESFDLTTLTLVGTYKKKGKDWVASIQDATGKPYTVRRGNYIGKNGGRIEKIDNQTIYIVEQVLNAAGDIVDRQVTLKLRERN